MVVDVDVVLVVRALFVLIKQSSLKPDSYSVTCALACTAGVFLASER